MKNLFALFLALFSAIPLYANAGAWLQEEGKGQIITNYFYLNSAHAFNAKGSKVKSPEFTKNEINPYAEYGLSQKYTVGGAASFQSIKAAAGGDAGIKFSYFDVFGRVYLYKDSDYAISIEPSVRVPVEATAQVNPEGNKPIPELKLNFGHSFKLYGLDNYTSLSASYRKRELFDDMVKFEVTLGTHAYQDITVMSQLFVDKTLTNDYTKGGNYDLVKAQLSGLYDISDKYAVQGGAFSNLAGKNTSADSGLIMALWYKF